MTTLPGKAFAHRNRMGVTFYLHEGRTKTGKPRFFVSKTIGEGALARVPQGFEVCESINGVVSVRKAQRPAAEVPREDVAVVRQALERCAHLRSYEVRSVDDAIVIYEPHPRPNELRAIGETVGMARLSTDFVSERMARARYDPVMKFVPEGDGYAVFRMTYRGRGGWSYPLKSGKLRNLAYEFVPSVGTEDFFDLM